MDDATALVEPAVALVHRWLATAEQRLRADERRTGRRLHQLTGDPASLAFAMAFCDRVLRPERDEVAAGQLRAVAAGPLPAFLGPIDRVLLAFGARLAPVLPRVVMPLARRRLRQIVGGLVVDRTEPHLGHELRRLDAEGYDLNLNLLGESVLGDEEAARRVDATAALLGRADVDYVSVKASSVTSQINLWAYDRTVERVTASLRRLFEVAAAADPPKFVNLDMEEYKDLHLTIDAFSELLDEPAFHALEAGIVLQAYLPDSFAALQGLVAWAQHRHAAGGAGIKVRVVKGANLAMERVDAAMHGWEQAPYETKAETDANYKRMLDWAMVPERTAAVRLGVASHNLFDVAWAWLLAEQRGVAHRVELEMLQGMAPGVARTVRDAAGELLLYTPVVATADFDTALAYLFRRLEENASGDNFLRHMFDLAADPAAFAAEEQRFVQAVTERWDVSAEPRRHRARSADGPQGGQFANEADTDPSDPAARAPIVAALGSRRDAALPPQVLDPAEIDVVVATARHGFERWRATPGPQRAQQLRAAADHLAAVRPDLLAVMAHEAGKTLVEGDGEVSEAVDFGRYYAGRIADLDRGDGATFEPLGVVAVVPPWNFPLAIPAGGVFAALAAGNSVILKPAPETPRTAWCIVEACLAAGIPDDVVQYLRCPDGEVGSHLIAHPGLDGIVLTGAYETAERFRELAPGTALFAETSGKNAIVVLPDADLDQAVADLVRSAFGHAGQKCSAASLAICVGPVATSERFRRQLVDAASSLVVAGAERPDAVVGPLVGPPSDKLHRALTSLDPGQRWLLEPRALDPDRNLWSPGIVEGVEPGSWFHQTECFGPVLGIVAVADLDEALAVQNGVPFGLTGGIHSLDPAHVEHWLAHVQVGNAYVNRAITGAIVQRQPFGGWKRSVVGPAAKAGGPNYVAELGRWGPVGAPTVGRLPSARMATWARALGAGLDADERAGLAAAARSDAHWWAVEFSVEHDPTGLFCEANRLRYRPLPTVVVRVAADAAPAAVARVLLAAVLVGSPLELSIDPGYDGPVPVLVHRREPGPAAAARLGALAPDRVRVVGTEPALASLPPSTFVDARPVVGDGRIELPRYLREQAISRTLHRFGNLVGTTGAAEVRR